MIELTEEVVMEALRRAAEDQEKILRKAKEAEKMTTDELIDAVKQWGADKGLNDPKAQLNKVIEEALRV